MPLLRHKRLVIPLPLGWQIASPEEPLGLSLQTVGLAPVIENTKFRLNMVVSSEAAKTPGETAEMFAQRTILPLRRALNDFDMCAEGPVLQSNMDIYRRKYHFRSEQQRLQQIQLYLRIRSPEVRSASHAKPAGRLIIINLAARTQIQPTAEHDRSSLDLAPNLYSVTISDDINRIGRIDEVCRYVVSQMRVKG